MLGLDSTLCSDITVYSTFYIMSDVGSYVVVLVKSDYTNLDTANACVCICACAWVTDL